MLSRPSQSLDARLAIAAKTPSTTVATSLVFCWLLTLLGHGRSGFSAPGAEPLCESFGGFRGLWRVSPGGPNGVPYDDRHMTMDAASPVLKVFKIAHRTIRASQSSLETNQLPLYPSRAVSTPVIPLLSSIVSPR